MSQFEKIEELINITLIACEKWVKVGVDKMLRFEDPLEEEEISGHYGATHAAVAFIILGKSRKDEALLDKGKSLLSSIIKRWDQSKTLPDFHYDFNNFALCVGYDHLKEDDVELSEQIKKKVCTTSDSNHDTVNWLPMRWYVNKKRFEWTRSKEYQDICRVCKLKILQATNEDGGIEDILPKGTSFNLQYDLATVGVLQYIRCRGEDIDLSKQLGFLISNVTPDGDINYQGRGTNQIFAWGLWMYLLSSSGNESEINKALSFLCSKLPTMLDSNNILLNKWQGEEKYLWWDYHFCSVYTAHFLFWSVLALQDYKKKTILPEYSKKNDSGICITKTSNYFISTFDGRHKYLAESGPIISAIWMRKYGVINKGTFGPWQGAFGNKYSFSDVVLRNFVGLLKISNNKDWSKNKYFNRFFPNYKNNAYTSISPLNVDFKIVEEESTLSIVFNNRKKENVIFNFPVLEDIIDAPLLTLFVDGKATRIHCNMKIKTQYGWCKIFQSKSSSAHEWVLKIK